MTDQASADRDRGFARETGQLVVRGWTIWLTLYLLLAAINAVIERRGYHTRGYALLTVYAVQVVIVAGAWRAVRRSRAYPRVAWIALGGNLSICFAQALYNAHVAGDTLYEFITFLSFMLVSSVFIPWGAFFQTLQNIGIIAAYWLAIPRGASPVPAYDYLAIAANAGFSSLGAFFVDRYRRRLFEQQVVLQKANHDLQAAHKARSVMLSGLAHDMRTPLSVILGFSDLLAEERLASEEQLDAVRNIRREGQQLLYLVDGVVDLVRLQSGKLPCQRATFSLSEVLNPLRETTADLGRARGIVVRWNVPDGLMVDSDAAKVREIVRNLLSNAVKYTRDGEIRLSATANERGVEIVVADTGVGIAPEQLDAIFEQFHQLPRGEGPPVSGVGFGLYFVKRLVDVVGGRIEVESTGSGSTFRLSLPAEARTDIVQKVSDP
jgi:signal transduction histidine kinase